MLQDRLQIPQCLILGARLIYDRQSRYFHEAISVEPRLTLRTKLPQGLHTSEHDLTVPPVAKVRDDVEMQHSSALASE